MRQTEDMTAHPIIVCRHGADLLLCLSINKENHAGCHSYPFKCRGFDPNERLILRPSTHDGNMYSEKSDRKITDPLSS